MEWLALFAEIEPGSKPDCQRKTVAPSLALLFPFIFVA